MHAGTIAQSDGLNSPADAPEARNRTRLRDILEEKAFSTGPMRRLSSGRESNFFFNLKPTMMEPEGLRLMADALLAYLRGRDVSCVGGLAMGAVPLVAAACAMSHATDHPVHGFFVRKAQKTHGMEQSVDGTLVSGSEVVVIDDVATTGGSALLAVEAALGRGCTVNHVWVVVDRLEGAKETFAEHGLTLDCLFDRNDFPA